MGGIALMLLLVASPAWSETPEEWVTLGTRVYGRFAIWHPIGIRIGEDALRRLGVVRGEVYVIYTSGKAPCPCVADGIAIATQTSVGQGTLRVTTQRLAPAGALGVAIVRDRKSGKGLRYTIPASLLTELLRWDHELDPLERYKAVMAAPEQFQVVAAGPEDPF
jgi:formylmethanofuran dehydrogenase subunit E